MTTAVGNPALSCTPFDELYRAEYPRLVAIARRIVADRADAEDVAQDVFVALAARREPARRADRGGPTRLRPWPPMPSCAPHVLRAGGATARR